ncbi:GTP-binding protein 1 [Tetranychus urticae]|uniref:GTP-binding protein 1 n=1 Tax=Tetranychus urticae TaxID=32264 RepID=T1JRV7_TETUR|nr:GTP-binding protein 1 [Tetranychus urticae]XP_015781091.1 GTP-binding protein 1 [Tetranychus urticae]XP_025017588.1 GTP-binding protein 1 [Tetranychus urticae]
MEPIFDATPTTAKQISDLFGNAANNDLSSSTKGDESSRSQSSKEPNERVLDQYALIRPDEDIYKSLVDHIKAKLFSGNGETLYQIGVNERGDNGLSEDEMTESIATLSRIVAELNADYVLLRSKTLPNGKQIGDYLIRERAKTNDFHEVRVAVVGNVDAGKSTLLGVLTHGELDNGRGLARQRLFRHKHEMESGRTSSVGNDILGFDSKGAIVNSADTHAGHLDWVKICEASSKVITFIDLAGHERYLKTTIFGMTGHAPDYTMLMVGANAGVVGMTKEHLGLALALNVPVFVVITKVDMCPPNVLANTLKLLQRILKSPGCRKIPVMVGSEDDVVLAACNFATERLCPIFQVSNVSGLNLDLLKMFMNLLMPRSPNYDNEPAEFQIDDTYSVPGVGTVVSGLCIKGVIRVNDVLYLGPDSLGKFTPIAIKSIHRKRMPVKEVRSGQTASFALKKMKRSDTRKGMFLLAPSLNPQAYWEFEGEILVLHHPTTISPRYQAMVHCGSIRQTATIIRMTRECLRTGDKAGVLFRFIKNPEYLREGQKMVFREGRTKAIGNIVRLISDAAPNNVNKTKAKKMVRQMKTSPEDGPSDDKSGKKKGRHRNFYPENESTGSNNVQ